MKSQVLHTVWCNFTGEAEGDILTWSLLGVKGLSEGCAERRDTQLSTDGRRSPLYRMYRVRTKQKGTAQGQITIQTLLLRIRTSTSKLRYIYLIDRVRGPYWENIGPRSWQYGPSRFGEVRTRKTEGRYSPSTARANSVNKRFITRLLVSEKTRTANATSMAAREDCQNQTDCIRRISCTTIIDTVVSILLSNASLYQSASCQIESFPHRVKLDLRSSIKSWSIAAVRNDFAVFMLSSFLWSSQIVYMSKPSSKWGPSSPGQELLCVSRRNFANLDLLRIRHFEKFDFRSDTHGTGLIHGKYQTGNRAIWLVDFLYQPSQELSRVIR